MLLLQESARRPPPVAGKAAGEVRTLRRLQQRARQRHLHLDMEPSQRLHLLRTGLPKRLRLAARGTQMMIERLCRDSGRCREFLVMVDMAF